MDLDCIRQSILDSDEFLLAETRKIQFLYGLKREIRYGEVRHEPIETESVAEHIYGMQVLCNYFLPLEDAKHTYNAERILSMIVFHDADEIVAGDTIGYLKTEVDRAREKDAMQLVLSSVPEVMQARVRDLIEEYEAQETAESRFVKALDKIEPLIHLYNENGKAIIQKNGTTRAESHRIKDKYVEEFPYLKRFNAVLNEQMDLEGFFSPQLPLHGLSKD